MSPYHSLVNHSVVNHATVPIVSAHISNTHHNYNRQTQWRVTLLYVLLLALLLIGCGPKSSGGSTDLSAETVRIAQEYQQSGDVASARAQLGKLDVANPTQFLIYLAEERVNSAPGTP